MDQPIFELEEILEIPPFSVGMVEKDEIYRRALNHLTFHHQQRCEPYRHILRARGYTRGSQLDVDDIPFIPVRLFKDYELASVDRGDVVKTMTSSGTTGQSVSKIFLDRATSSLQTKVLTKLTSTLIGKKRLPMLIIDSKAVIKDRNLFSARGAGILGFSMFGHDVTYALDDEMHLDLPAIQEFISRHPGSPILLFGFTFMIWEHFYLPLLEAGVHLPLEDAILIHGGGWKKLIDKSVDNETFKRSLNELCFIKRVHNYYGMVEQTGSIFLECPNGHLHASLFSDILIRDHRDFAVLPIGSVGLVQLLSLIPLSYPGHSILSEDLGEIIGEDDCPCGWMGKYFKIHGRIQNAEVRGCSDTYVPT